MVNMAIQVLWFLIGLIVLCGVVYLVIYVIEWATETPLPDKLKKGVWLIVFLLALIALLTALLGGGIRFPRIGGIPGGAAAALPAAATGHLPQLLG